MLNSHQNFLYLKMFLVFYLLIYNLIYIFCLIIGLIIVYMYMLKKLKFSFIYNVRSKLEFSYISQKDLDLNLLNFL